MLAVLEANANFTTVVFSRDSKPLLRTAIIRNGTFDFTASLKEMARKRTSLRLRIVNQIVATVNARPNFSQANNFLALSGQFLFPSRVTYIKYHSQTRIDFVCCTVR